MGEHDARIGVGGEQRLEAPQVGAGLEHPAVTGLAPPEMLQLLAMEVVDGREVGLVVDPVLVARNAELVVEERRAHRLAHHHHALLRQQRAGGMHGLEELGLPIAGEDLRLALRIAVGGCVPVVGGGRGELPGERRPVRGVLRRDVVEDRGALRGSPTMNTGFSMATSAMPG
jgi:hypothetical protein